MKKQNYPPICTQPFNNPIKHLCYHIMPLANEHEWVIDKSIKQLCKGIGQFNGKRVIAIATFGGLGKEFICPDDVINKFKVLGVTKGDVDFIVVKNKKIHREVVSFIPMLTKVMCNDPEHVVFYGHCKGITHADPNSVCHTWADCMYETVYNNWEQAKIALEHYGIAGSFKRYGTFKTVGNHKWHYSGTFYWFRCASVFPRAWQQVDHMFAGTESWPGKIFRPYEAACLFHDYTDDLYKTSSRTLLGDLEAWRKQPFKVLEPEQYKQLLLSNGVNCIMSF